MDRIKVRKNAALYYRFFRKASEQEGGGVIEKDYDIIIIGTGTAGRTFANKVAHSGLETAIIDSGGYGGISPPSGCDPKRYLQI